MATTITASRRLDRKKQSPSSKEVLRDAPNDSAANHYWIHAIEPGNHPELALTSARLLASLAPTSGHMVHMPGHIFYRVGDYKEAEHWFTASMETDEKYMREQHVGVDDDWNYVHNMMYAIANLMEQGKLADANSLSDRLPVLAASYRPRFTSGPRAIRWRASAIDFLWRCALPTGTLCSPCWPGQHWRRREDYQPALSGRRARRFRNRNEGD